MQNADQTSGALGSQPVMGNEPERLNAALSGSSNRVFQCLSGEGFVLVGYQPPHRTFHSVPRLKQISTGDFTS